MNILEWEERQGMQWPLCGFWNPTTEELSKIGIVPIITSNYNKNNRFVLRCGAGYDPSILQAKNQSSSSFAACVSKNTFFSLGVVFRPIISLEVEAEGWEGEGRFRDSLSHMIPRPFFKKAQSFLQIRKQT